jgi:ubiquinone/menaquinone biosynthesis C-methylase UbiE
MKIADQERDWNELAELDPYWAILTSPGTRFGAWDSEAFFSTGRAEVEAFMRDVETLGHPRGRSRALDFGCGVGRVSRSLADHFDEVVGVDISKGMVEQARRLNADVPGVSFLVNAAGDLRRFDDESFDLVYSVIVLQHVPDRAAIEGYIAEFCRVLRPGGLAVFTLPSHIPRIFRLQWRRHLYLALRRAGVSAGVLYRRLHLMPIAMSYIATGDISTIVAQSGAKVLRLDTVGASGMLNAGLRNSTYYVTR